MRRRLLRSCAQLWALALTVLVGVSGCVTELAAEKVVAPPNGGRAALGDMAISPFVDDGFRLVVGPPRATMMVWVVEPKPCEVFNVRDPAHVPPPAGPGRFSVMKTGPTRQGVSAGITQVIRYPTPGGDTQLARHAEPRGTIVMLQGYSCHVRRNAYLWPWAAAFANAGYRVVMPDLRGHGDSTGGRFTWGVQETEDLVQLIDALEDRKLLAGKLAVFGHSTGASVAIAAAARDERIACVVAASPWATMRDAIEGFRDWKLPWLSWVLNDGVLDVVARRAGEHGRFDPRDASALKWISRTDTPVLIFHGGADPLLPAWQSEAIYLARPENTHLVIYPGDDHWSHLELRFTDMRDQSLRFLDAHLRVTPGEDDDRLFAREERPSPSPGL